MASTSGEVKWASAASVEADHGVVYVETVNEEPCGANNYFFPFTARRPSRPSHKA